MQKSLSSVVTERYVVIYRREPIVHLLRPSALSLSSCSPIKGFYYELESSLKQDIWGSSWRFSLGDVRLRYG